ncbi:MAG: hypothetical protein AB7F67_12950 [Rhodospirillaceae bacterium]
MLRPDVIGPLIGLVFGLAALALLLGLAAAGLTAPAEDAVILFSYAENLARTGAISFYPGGPPAEGATDFLFMAAIAGLHLLGLPSETAAFLLSAAGIGATVALTLRIAAAAGVAGPGRPAATLAVAVVSFGSLYFFAVLQGFSPALAVAAVAAMTWLYLSGRDAGLYFAGFLACLLRPDMIVFAASYAVASLLRGGFAPRLLLRLAALAVVPGLAYFAWRAAYFGHLLPLPFYVKSASVRDLLGVFYLKSVLYNGFALAVSPLAVLAPLLLFARRADLGSYLRRMAAPIAAAAAGLLFYSVVLTEQNIGMRFQAPIYFLFVVLALHLPAAPMAKQRLVLAALLPALVLIGWGVRESARLSRDENMTALARGLGALPRGTMLVTEAGRLPYFSRWTAYDAWGLNTPELAKRLVAPDDVARLDPDLIVLHYDVPLPQDWEGRLRTRTARTWLNQCENLLLGARGGYEAWAVPFYRTETASYARHPRHDLFLIRRDSALRDGLAGLFARRQGVPLSELPARFDGRWPLPIH